jgi:hypothetical protein
MGGKTFEGKERMLEDWGRVMIAIIRSENGGSNVEYKRDDAGNVVGLTAELEMQLENASSDSAFTNYDNAVEEAKKQMADAVTDTGEFTAKQRLLIDWVSMRNSILRAQSGEMKVGIRRNKFAGNMVVGLSAELDLNFDGPIEATFTDDEKASIDEAKDADN